MITCRSDGRGFWIDEEKDEHGRPFLCGLNGPGETFIVPEGTYGIRKSTFRNVQGTLRRIFIPKSVQVIEENTFINFRSPVGSTNRFNRNRSPLTIYCQAESKPDGFFELLEEETFEEDYDFYTEAVWRSWLGSFSGTYNWRKNPMPDPNDMDIPAICWDVPSLDGIRETVALDGYYALIQRQLAQGILLNTNGDKFNTMVIGWAHLGVLWGLPTFTIYVRQSRYTKRLIDQSGEFTISVPLDVISEKINKVCGTKSGAQVDKVREAGLTLVPPLENNTPGLKEYPLTIECRVLYAQDQDVAKLPEHIRVKYYPVNLETAVDFHTMYVGEIVNVHVNL